MAVESATVATFVRENTLAGFPYLTKLLANFPDAAHDFRQLFRDQMQARELPVDQTPYCLISDCTLHDFVFTIRIHEPGLSTFDWCGKILDPDYVRLWIDADAPDWCTEDPAKTTEEEEQRLSSLKIDLLVSRMTPHGLRTVKLCEDVATQGVEQLQGEMCFHELMPNNAAAAAVLELRGEPSILFRPWIQYAKGSGTVDMIFRLDDEELETVTADGLLTYLKHMAPWGDANV